MSVVLPLVPQGAEIVNPRNLIIFSKPKMGKTSLVAQLPNCLILDLEKGSKFLEALKIEANSFEDIKEIGKAIKEQGVKYDYIAIDTITALEEIAVSYAEILYSQTPIGKKWFEKGGGKEKYKTIISLPEGAGYHWQRIAFQRIIEYIQTWAPNIILLGHVKDTQLDKEGGLVVVNDLDLIGKNKRITAANSDAIGYLYRKGNKNILSFKTKDDVLCGARPKHLSNQEIVISEMNDSGELITHWDKIFIK